MIWKRDAQGHFTNAQRRKMKQMKLAGRSFRAIADVAGCAVASVHRILRTPDVLLKKESEVKRVNRSKPRSADASRSTHQSGDSKNLTVAQALSSFSSACQDMAKTVSEPSTTEPSPKPSPLEAHLQSLEAYLRWALTGALGRIGDKNFIDRLLDDLKSGTYG